MSLKRCSEDPLTSLVNPAVTWTATTASKEEMADPSDPEYAHLFVVDEPTGDQRRGRPPVLDELAWRRALERWHLR